jgi:preprotein translocase subunit SecA
LNAKHHEREAEIVAQAGRKGAITIATNMAGRGTDIMLGGNADIMAKKSVNAEEGPEYEEALARFKKQCEDERKHVVGAGGLYIVGTERHESRRIDNQLRGRSGRQGDPGESKFYLSLEDNLMRIFNGERIQKVMSMLNIPEDEPITARMVTNSIEGAQRKVEGHHFDVRKNLLDYDNVMNMQRNEIYGMRRRILEGQEIERTILDMLGDVTTRILDAYVPADAKRENWSIEGLVNALQQQLGLKLSVDREANSEKIEQSVQEGVKQIYGQQKSSMGPYFEQIQKMVLLQAIDQRWKEHLLVIDKLKEGIGLRGYSGKDPLIEYKKEAFTAFGNLKNTIESDVIEKVMRVQIVAQQAEEALESFRPTETDLDELDYQSPTEADSFGGMPSGGSAQSSRGNGSGGPKRMTFSNGPQDDQKMNRADRRRMEKNQRKK